MTLSTLVDGICRRFVLCGCMVGVTGCGSSESPSVDSAPPEGTGTGAGTLEGHPFGTVGASYMIGRGDDPAKTTVIYVFDAPVSCTDLGRAGWDTRIAEGTGALELKLLGTEAGEYPVSATPNGVSGESSVNFTVSSTAEAPKEESGNAGSATLDGLAPGHAAVGSFDLTFPDGVLSGTFRSLWCADGQEP